MIKALLRNIVSNWAGFAVQALLAFVLTPMVIHSLGSSRYGIWILITSLTGYSGLLDLGFRAGMTQYMTRYLTKKDYDKLNEVVSTAFVALLCCGIVVLLVTFLLVWIAPIIFEIGTVAIIETRWCLLILGVSTAIQFAYYPFASVFPATQRYDISNAVIISTRLLTGIAMYAALRLGLGLVQLSLINVISDQILYAVLKVVSRRVLPEMAVSIHLARWRSLSPLFSFGFWSFFVTSASRLKFRADAVIIGLFMPVAAIAPYALGLSLAEYFESVFVPIGFVFFPLMTQLDAQGDTATARKLYLSGTKLLLILSGLGAAIGASFAPDFFQLWVRNDVTSKGIYPSPHIIFWILIGASALTAGQHVGYQALTGSRRVKVLAIVVMCEVTLKIILSSVLILPFGLYGVAIGTLVPSLVFQGVVIPAVTCRSLDIPLREYASKTLLRPILVLLAFVGAIIPVLYFLTMHHQNWSQLLLSAAVQAGLATPLIFLLGLDRKEREQVVFGPAGRFLKYLRSLTL